jgi:hypothetical protein
MRLDSFEMPRFDRVGDAPDREDALVDVRRRVLEPHERRGRRIEGVDIDAGGGERLRNTGIRGCTPRDRRDAKAEQARRVRGVVVAAAVHVASAGRRHDRVLGVVANRDEIVVLHSRSLTRQSVAARIIDTALEPIQKAIAGPKS